MVYEANMKTAHAQPFGRRLTELDSSKEKGWTYKKTNLFTKEGDWRLQNRVQ